MLMIKIYEISKENLAKIKAILEASDVVSGEIEGVELESESGKKGAKVEKAKEWKLNEFKRQGYILRDAKALDIEKPCSYLYIEGSEDFFSKNEKILLDAGAKALSGEEFDKVKEKIKAGEDAAAESIGAVFK